MGRQSSSKYQLKNGNFFIFLVYQKGKSLLVKKGENAERNYFKFYL